ncbi:glycosyltransferase family 9 protein [Colwellia sp. UCD-KL20]|uniref:glycosyltransferase family 9 protein n=1 Tax=Colwellia sp. UCD-KL20 TaxID=1917165 RepID=UPI0009714186|nr:glycosyltransferase family 9 protein [Colwellia sp. UCD-KL20]
MLGQLAAPKNLCVLRLSAIGDVCHAVAAVQNIQKQWPHTQITWVCGKVEANLLKGLEKVEIIVFDKSAGLKGYSDLRDHMKGQHFDILLHMQVALRASLASYCIPAKTKIGFDSKRAKEGQWLFTNYKIAPQNEPHVLDGFMGFTQALGLTVNEPVWNMPLPEEDEQWAHNTLFEENNKPVAVISPAASKAERNWHVTGYAQTAEYLQQVGFRVVICGGPTAMEKQLAEDICKQSNASITNLVGKTSLKQLLAVLKLAHITIAPDTGPAHMSVTVGTPVIGLYAHSNPRRTGPYLYQKYVVSCYDQVIEEQKGKPYTQLSWGVRAKGSDLMERLTIEEVKAKINLVVEDFYPELKAGI